MMMTTLTSLGANDPRLHQTLWTGRYSTEDGEKAAILQSVHSGHEKQFLFELRDFHHIARPPLMKCILIEIRIFSLTASATPGLVVLGSGILFAQWRANWQLFFASLLSVIFLQIAVNVFNDVEDHLKGIDLPGEIGGSGVIQKAWLSAKSVSRVGYASLVLACFFGIFPVLAYPKELFAIGGLAFLGGMGYSGFGIGLKYRAMGDFAVFLLCGPLLTIGFSIATFGKLNASMGIAGMIFGLASVAILHANNLNDLEIDLRRGARTVANQIGFKWSQKYLALIYIAIFMICLISPLFLPKLVIFLLAPLIVSPVVFQMLKKVKKASGPLSPSVANIRFEAAQIHLLIGCAWFLAFFCLILKRIFSN